MRIAKLTPRQKYEALKMTPQEFEVLCQSNWAPVKLNAATLPACLSGLPSKVIAVYGSGSIVEPNPVTDGNRDQGQLGGLDVYREAEERDGVLINKDWYAIHYDPSTPEVFYLLGPKKDAEHWIDEIPKRLALAEPQSVERELGNNTHHGADTRPGDERERGVQ